MAAITSISDEHGFSAGVAELDWGIDAASGDKIIGAPISGLTDVYVANGGAVVVNDNGMAAFAQDTTTMNVNLGFGSTMLVADEPPVATMANATPIKLSFSVPLREVGAYVTIAGDSLLWKWKLCALMLVRLSGDPTWRPITPVIGAIGPTPQKGVAPDVAFVGVRAGGAETITGVKFDAKLIGSRRTYPSLVISNLFWVG